MRAVLIGVVALALGGCEIEHCYRAAQQCVLWGCKQYTSSGKCYSSNQVCLQSEEVAEEFYSTDCTKHGARTYPDGGKK